MTRIIKDFLLTWKIDLEKEDIYSEAPVEGGPKVARLSEDFFFNFSTLFLSIENISINKSINGFS